MRSEKRLLDTNFIVRYLIQDDERQAQQAERLFGACDRGEVQLVLLALVLAECVFVLQSFYKRSREYIAEGLQMLLSNPDVVIADKGVYMDALARYGSCKAHFVDCTIAAHGAAGKLAIATFDEGFAKFHDVTVKID